MADDDTPSTNKPAPRRRAARKSEGAAGKSAAGKRASRPSTPAPKKAAAAKSTPAPVTEPRPTEKSDVIEPARAGVSKAADAVGGKRNVGLIAGGLAVAGMAAAALFSLRSSTPRKGGAAPSAKAHQPDGTDSSAQMDAMIADESMIPESTPKG